ncbi:MAG: hypothetical protein NTZ53_12155 [Cyanobacteria bacterium]|nr:hypothetical protein [Cyanobacteriota bacterium]
MAPTAPRGALQEVAPPALVQQLRARLDRHDPQVFILAPADGALLPAGSWTLELQVQDWPLVDAGPLGLGPHLVVQLDDAPPRRISEAAAASHLTMPPLTPGSHRLTVYAARPWGEVVKAPGASRQIRLDRVAANRQQVPAPGSPQLLASLASPEPGSEPVLIDWLLLDAPLQHLRDNDDSWRLRVSVNGDSFLVDRQTPLWLKGFHGGSNAVQLELLDGRGEPLNPPFNSLIEEVVIQPGRSAAWQRPSLTAQEQAQLLGEAPLAPTASPTDRPAGAKQPMAAQPLPLRSDIVAQQSVDQQSVDQQSVDQQSVDQQSVDQQSVDQQSVDQQSIPTADQASRPQDDPNQFGTSPSPFAPPASTPLNPLETESARTQSSAGPEQTLASQAPAAPDTPRGPEAADAGIPAAITKPITKQGPVATTAEAAEEAAESSAFSAQDSPPAQASDTGPAGPAPERLSPSSTPSGRARDQVAADSSQIKPRPEGPLARLRQRFQP